MEMNKVTKNYGKKPVVTDVDLPISEGQMTALIGPNMGQVKVPY